MKSINLNYLNRFMAPITHFSHDDRDLFNEMNERAQIFIKENDALELKELMQKAEAEFGKEVLFFERYYQFKHLKGIYNMMKFFLILTVLGIISGIILMLM